MRQPKEMKYDLALKLLSLFILHKSFFGDNYLQSRGLCSFIDKMQAKGLITYGEAIAINQLIHQNKPIGKKRGQYWWKQSKYNVRLRFLMRLVNKYAPKGQ